MKRNKAVRPEEKCGAQFDTETCIRKKGHSGKHLDTGSDLVPKFCTWTDAGVARVLKERAALAAKCS